MNHPEVKPTIEPGGQHRPQILGRAFRPRDYIPLPAKSQPRRSSRIVTACQLDFRR